jgi:hypothetical protein
MKALVRPSTAADMRSLLGLFEEAGLRPNGNGFDATGAGARADARQ